MAAGPRLTSRRRVSPLGRPGAVCGAARSPSDARGGITRVDVDPAAGRVTVTGRLDARAAHLLHDAVSALPTGHRDWTVDVGGLAGMDRAGLHVLLGVYHRALRHGRRLVLRDPSPSLRRLLAALRLDGHLLDDEHPERPTGRPPVPAGARRG